MALVSSLRSSSVGRSGHASYVEVVHDGGDLARGEPIRGERATARTRPSRPRPSPTSGWPIRRRRSSLARTAPAAGPRRPPTGRTPWPGRGGAAGADGAPTGAGGGAGAGADCGGGTAGLAPRGGPRLWGGGGGLGPRPPRRPAG